MQFSVKSSIRSACGVLFLALLTGVASAAISVYPIHVTVNKQGSAQIKVMSASSKMDFVKVTVKAIDNPGTKEEKERELVAGENLVVTPAKFALSAGSVRIVRMVNIVSPEIEKAYRVYFESVDNLDDSILGDETKNNIGVNIMWGALVIVPPLQPHEEIYYLPTEHQLVNNGNVHITLKEVGLCKSKNESEDCRWSENKSTIYPQQKLTLNNTGASSISSEDKVKIKYISSISQTMQERTL